MGTYFCENSRSYACLRTITIHINYHMHFSNQVKHDSPDNDSSVMFRDSCISELPTQASFDVASRSVIQVPPDINSEDRDDGDDSDEPPVKRVYTETNANGSSGISKLVEFCSKDIKYVASLVFWGYVHTVTFLHGFVLFHNPKGIPVYFQTIENDAKTLPCAHSLGFSIENTLSPPERCDFYVVAKM